MDLMDDVDALYFLPLTEFTAARDALAKALKKSGQADEAQRVKALSKRSIKVSALSGRLTSSRKGDRHARHQSGHACGTKTPFRKLVWSVEKAISAN